MINKKGFTIVEVIVSFSLISILLASMISTMMYYRDKVKDEEVKTQLWDFKNTITKTVYDDIINSSIVRVETCIGAQDCVNLIDINEQNHVLKIVEVDNDDKRRVYLSYDGIKYMLPDSDLGTGNDRICDFVGGLELSSYNNKLYKIKLAFRHKDMGIHYDLLFIVG